MVQFVVIVLMVAFGLVLGFVSDVVLEIPHAIGLFCIALPYGAICAAVLTSRVFR